MPPRPTKADPSLLRIHPEVADALAQGRAVVALETTLLAHGLPRPLNLQVGRELEAVVRAVGAIPATIGVLAGVATVGLTDAELERLAGSESVAKLSDRDLAPAMARGCDGATTVAATVTLAAWAGIRVMATGGLGGSIAVRPEAGTCPPTWRRCAGNRSWWWPQGSSRCSTWAPPWSSSRLWECRSSAIGATTSPDS